MTTLCVHGVALSAQCDQCKPSFTDQPATHNPDFFIFDRRPINEALLGSWDDGVTFRASFGDKFQRFERSGEMASIPYLRVTHAEGVTEAPLTHFAYVQYAPEPEFPGSAS